MILNSDVSLMAMYADAETLRILAWDDDGHAMVRPRNGAKLKRAVEIEGFERIVSRFAGYSALIPAPDGTIVVLRSAGNSGALVFEPILAWGTEPSGASRADLSPCLPTPLVLGQHGELMPLFAVHEDELIVDFVVPGRAVGGP